MKNLKKILKPKNLVAKDLHTSKYRMRVAETKISYQRQSEKQKLKKELAYVYSGI
jgi:hypothetical protein